MLLAGMDGAVVVTGVALAGLTVMATIRTGVGVTGIAIMATGAGAELWLALLLSGQ